MFTGIIEELGRVASIEFEGDSARLSIFATLAAEDAQLGDSIAINGVCLTVIGITANGFSFDVSRETLDRTTIGTLEVDAPVNLERAATPQTRLGGHIVQGHVDGRGTFLSANESGDFHTVRIGFPKELARYFVFKGSVAVEGISLTIAALSDDSFEIAVIPKTWDMTNLSFLKPGEAVNLEADVIAKYVERMLETRA